MHMEKKKKRRRQKRHQVEKYVAPQHTSHAGLHSSGKRRHIEVCPLFTSPMCCAGPDTGCEGSEPERSTAGPYCIDWSLKLGCLILGALNSRSSETLCQQELKVGPLVIRRYAFVFGCFFRAPIILLGASHTFLPTLLFVSITSIHYGAPSTLL